VLEMGGEAAVARDDRPAVLQDVPRWTPGPHAAMPAFRHAFVVSTRRITSGSVTPSMTVRDVSPL